jgi:hypothetical protein
VFLDKQPEQKGEKPREFYERKKLELERNHLKLAFMQWEDLAYLTGLRGEN